MKKLMLLGSLCVAAVLFAACGGASENKATAEKTPSTPPTQDELASLDRQASQAWIDHDTHFFETFLSDNFIGFGLKRWTDKETAIKEVTDHKCEVKTFSMEEPMMKIISQDVALLTYKAIYDGTCEGKKMSNARAATAFVRKGPLWLAAYHSETPITAQAADKDAKDVANKPAANKPAANTAKAPAARTDAEKAANPSGTVDVKKDANAENSNTTAANTPGPGDTIASKDPALTDALFTVERTGWEAWKDKDAKKLDEITTKDVMFVDPTGAFFPDKASTLKAWAEQCSVSSVGVSEAESASVTAEVGILTYKGTATGTCGSQKLGPVWAATVFLNQGGLWKAAFIIEQPAM